MSLPDADVVLLQPGDMGSGEDLLAVTNATTKVDDFDDFDTVATINFVAYNVVAFVIVGVGIVGNILNLVVLSRPKLKGVMYVYLLGLALSNLCVLIMAIPALMDIAGDMDSRDSYSIAFFKAHLEIPMLNSFMATSVYIIISMTVNRYISIYKPTDFQRIHTFKNAYIIMFISFLCGCALHVPLGFNYVVGENCNRTATEETLNADDGGGGGGDEECDEYVVKSNNSIEEHILFRVYLWVSEALLRLLPIVTLTILNFLIIVKFRKIAKKRQVLKTGGGGRHRRGGPGCLAGVPSSSGGERSSTPIAPALPSAYTSSSSSSACTTSTAVRSASVTDANGRLSVPAVTVGCIAEDECSGAVNPTAEIVVAAKGDNGAAKGDNGAAKGDNGTAAKGDNGPAASNGGLGGIISRAATPLFAGPMRRVGSFRGTPQRASSKRRGLHNPEEKMLVFVLIAIVALFVVCTTPAALLSIVISDERKKKVWFSVFRACANNLELLCFACNFFVYCLCSAEIRRAFVDVLFENCAVRFVRRRSSTAKAAAAAVDRDNALPPVSTAAAAVAIEVNGGEHGKADNV